MRKGYHKNGKPMKPEHREPGVIDFARRQNCRDDGEHNTISVGVKFGGSFQCFGGLCLPDEKLLRAYENRLCEAFSVHKLDLLKGMACVALRNFSSWNSEIIGIESVETGKVFLNSTFQREDAGMKLKHPLEEAQEGLRRRIESCYDNIKRFERELETIGDDYAEHDITYPQY